MKYFIFVLFSVGVISGLKSQNLVPNNSFEVYDTCPDNTGQIRYAIPWVDPTNASSDYFDTCSPFNIAHVPNNYVGIQNAKDGNAYAGFVAYVNSLTNRREYVQVELTDTLKNNTCYRLIFYVSIAEAGMYGVNTLSAYFSNTAITGCVNCFLSFTPQFLYYDVSGLIGNDTTWYKVEGTFTASGGERFMTIGNFKSDANTTVTLVNTGAAQDVAYYYIDDISLTLCSGIGIDELEMENKIKLYPNPSNGVFTIGAEGTKIKEIKVYNVLGCEILKQVQNVKETIIDFSDKAKGIYFLEIQTEQGIIRKKFVNE